MQATIKQLRRETGAVVRAVARGETVIVTFRGRPVAKMSTLDSKDNAGATALFGIWRDNDASVSPEDYVSRVRKGRVA